LEIDEEEIERHITEKTRSVMLVHLYGRCAFTPRIAQICSQHQLLLVEDNAQAHGCCTADGRHTGSLGAAAGHSFYPGKNLGALGDGGAVTTDDEELAEVVRALSNYGSHKKYVFQYKGRNSRLDEIQAAVLSVKLKYLDADNRHRRDIARIYREGIDNRRVWMPDVMPDERMNVYHLFPVFCEQRDDLQTYLSQHGIQTLIHYPIAPHQQECYQEMGYLSLPVTEQIHRQELSLPMSQVMEEEEAKEVVRRINEFK
jgi:dTDP-4-amino-4,6-dideoxygalactose transaminase